MLWLVSADGSISKFIINHGENFRSFQIFMRSIHSHYSRWVQHHLNTTSEAEIRRGWAWIGLRITHTLRMLSKNLGQETSWPFQFIDENTGNEKERAQGIRRKWYVVCVTCWSHHVPSPSFLSHLVVYIQSQILLHRILDTNFGRRLWHLLWALQSKEFSQGLCTLPALNPSVSTYRVLIERQSWSSIRRCEFFDISCRITSIACGLEMRLSDRVAR